MMRCEGASRSPARLEQSSSRSQRLFPESVPSKRFVQVYDYVDDNVLMLARMYERRLKGYAAIGHVIEHDAPVASSVTA